MLQGFDLNQACARLARGIEKHKAFVQSFVMAFLLTMLFAVPVFANGESSSGNITSGMTTALQTAFAGVQADAISIITTALPYALAIMGVIVAIRVGIRFFRSAAK